MRRASPAVLALALAFGCTFKIDPDKARFACAGDSECGAGYVCVTQVAGGGVCFKAGTCTAETCDGADNDCNGAVDDAVPDQGAACESGLMGVCAGGTQRCDSGALRCVPNQTASAELCDGLDNDCDGLTDEDFNLVTDDTHCGACTVSCDAGTRCAASRCQETACSDGVDNDLDNAKDCEDDSCLGRSCSGMDASVNCGTLPPDAGAADAGTPDGGAADAGEPDAGVAPVRACLPRELSCDNALDDDGDRAIDCADPDCDGRTCGPSKVCAAGVCP